MKKKILLTIALISMFIFAFVIAVSAETPAQYIEFGARFPGSDEYITVYTQNAENGQQRINFASYKFYSDVEFTEEVDMSTATGIDFSVAKTHGCGDRPISRMTKPSSPFVNCVEVKWLSDGMTSCGSQFFKGWTGLKSFDFGNMTDISDNAFESCGLESLTIPSTVTSIGSNSFAKSLSLTSVKFEGNPSIHKYGATFSGCTELESVDLGPLTALGSSMFKNCTSLTSVEIPSTLTTIGSYAFQSSGITEITIPSTVTNIEVSAFNSCKSITSVTFNGGSASIASDCFANCSALTTVNFNGGFSGSIGSSAFTKTGITSLTIPNTISTIGNSAFKACDSLLTVNFEGPLPEGASLGKEIFMNCSFLQEATIPTNITELTDGMFRGCGGNKNNKATFTISNLSECTQLTTIGADQFRDCQRVILAIPDSVTTIGARAFQAGCKGGSITINKTSKLQTIGDNAFTSCTALTTIYIPSTVTSIGVGAFSGCSKLLSLENFENCQITVLSEKAFEGVTSMKTIKIPETVTTIENAFLGNKNLTKVYISKNVTSIADTFVNSAWENQSANAVYIYTGKDASALSACTRLAGANVITREEYDENATYTGINLVVNYSNCLAYNNGVHGKTETDTIVTSYLEPIKVVTKCILCEMYDENEKIPALFTVKGHSTPEYEEGVIDICVVVNPEAIEKYEKITGETVNYGLFVVTRSILGENDIVNENGEIASGVIAATLPREFSIMSIKIFGFETDAQKSAEFAFGAYVIDGKNTAYIQEGDKLEGDKYVFTSYNQVYGKEEE
jgi:hypothetical protein